MRWPKKKYLSFSDRPLFWMLLLGILWKKNTVITCVRRELDSVGGFWLITAAVSTHIHNGKSSQNSFCFLVSSYVIIFCYSHVCSEHKTYRSVFLYSWTNNLPPNCLLSSCCPSFFWPFLWRVKLICLDWLERVCRWLSTDKKKRWLLANTITKLCRICTFTAGQL